MLKPISDGLWYNITTLKYYRPLRPMKVNGFYPIYNPKDFELVFDFNKMIQDNDAKRKLERIIIETVTK